MIGAFALYTQLGSMVDVPRVHPDELRYALAGSSLADGEGVLNRVLCGMVFAQHSSSQSVEAGRVGDDGEAQGLLAQRLVATRSV